jgi:hypothetical protein
MNRGTYFGASGLIGLAMVLSGCGSSGEPLTTLRMVDQLNDAGVPCLQPDFNSVGLLTTVKCQTGVPDDSYEIWIFPEQSTEMCPGEDPRTRDSYLDETVERAGVTAYGVNWLTSGLSEASSSVVSPRDIADALGGEIGDLRDAKGPYVWVCPEGWNGE